MDKIAINQKVKGLKDSLKQVGSNLIGIAERFGVNRETREILTEQVENINENFLFVIVGEVNAGKSSFVNSLLVTPICATSHEICTQNVQKIVYGNEDKIIKDDYKRLVTREYPAEILKEITVVDTPGTNSREIDHQVITEKFIPKSNLIVFVFQMDNIHVESAWKLFRKIKVEWSKKIVFVLTKSDRYTDEEVENYKHSLRNHARKEGVDTPLIFITSAKLEDEGAIEKSGFAPIREYINTNILENVAIEKISEDVKIINKLLKDIDEEFDVRNEKFEADNASRRRIKTIINDKEALAHSNIQSLVKRCLNAYDRNTDDTLDKLNNGIGFFQITFKSIQSIFGGESIKDWLENVNKEYVNNLNMDINEVLESGTNDIKSDITYMVVGVKDELDKLKSVEVTANDMFSKLDKKRMEIIYSLKTTLTDFIDKSPVFNGGGILDSDKVHNKEENIAVGVAAIGTTVALIAQAAVLDITGGIASGLGILVAGAFAVSKKNKYLKEVKNTLNTKREELKSDLEQDLKSYFNGIKNEIDQQFLAFDHHLSSEEETIREFKVVSRRLKNELVGIEREL